tara:strand:+ start:751 stop:1110 length:360 start_codon:yes stop_codon:yes gene_type:complete
METSYLILKCSQTILKLELKKITHFLVNDYLLTVFCLNINSHSFCSSLKSMEDKLPENFFKINRNCIVNVNLIYSLQVKKREIIMQNDFRLKVAKSKWTEIKKKMILLNQLNNGLENTN